jgi:hypothetical protein
MVKDRYITKASNIYKRINHETCGSATLITKDWKRVTKSIGLCNILLLFIIVILCSCKDNSASKKNADKVFNLTKEDFLKCTNAMGSVFKNTDYVKFIQISNESYGIEIKMNEVIDTLDFHLTCKIYKGMIPKVLSKINSDYICLGQGSSSYRYLTLCSLNQKSKKIDVSKFETAISTNSNKDGFVFKINDTIFFYDLDERHLFFLKVSYLLEKYKIKNSRFYDSKVDIVFEKNVLLTYYIKDFQPYLY